MATSTVFHIPSLLSLFKPTAEMFFELIKQSIKHPILPLTILVLLAVGAFKRWIGRKIDNIGRK